MRCGEISRKYGIYIVCSDLTSFDYFLVRGTVFLKSLRSSLSVNFQQESLTQSQLSQLKVRTSGCGTCDFIEADNGGKIYCKREETEVVAWSRVSWNTIIIINAHHKSCTVFADSAG